MCGYHREARAGNTAFRLKTVIREPLRARSLHAQETEAAVACTVPNRMREHGLALHVGRDPQGDVAALDERMVVLSPVGHSILRLVLRVDSGFTPEPIG